MPLKKKEKKQVKILISKGQVFAIYDDEIAQALLRDLGAKAEIKRVSHVEPVPGILDKIAFEADLSPINGPKLTGFKTYKDAVHAEISWINTNFLQSKKPKGKL